MEGGRSRSEGVLGLIGGLARQGDEVGGGVMGVGGDNTALKLTGQL